YLEQLMKSILSRWITAQLSLAALVEMRNIFILKAEPKSFIQLCCPMLLPPLILRGNESDLNWIATVSSEPVATLVKHHFASIFAACLPLHCGNEKGDREKAASVLQGFILRVTMMSEDERDALIKKQMMAIVSSLIALCSSGSEPQFPYFAKDIIVLAIRTVVDGFLEIDQLPSNGVVDKIQIFRPDRVFMFLLHIHYQIDSAIHPRHRCHALSRISVLIDVIKHRASIPSTCRYLFHIILQSLRFQQLQDQCCYLLSSLLDIFQMVSLKEISHVLGGQLQSIVPKLVACCVSSDLTKSGEGIANSSALLLPLVHRLTVDADRSLYDYVKELDPFPDLDCFERIRNFHEELCFGQTPANEFIKFVERMSSLPQELRLRSLQRLHKKLQSREVISLMNRLDMQSCKHRQWPCDPGIVSAVWRLVELCNDDDDASDMRELVADFIARVSSICIPSEIPIANLGFDTLLDHTNNGRTVNDVKSRPGGPKIVDDDKGRPKEKKGQERLDDECEGRTKIEGEKALDNNFETAVFLQETTNLYLSQLTERLAQGRIEAHAEKGEANNMGQHGNRGESGHSGQGSPHASTRPLGLHEPSFSKDPKVSQTRQLANVVDGNLVGEKYRTLSESFRDNMPFKSIAKMKIGSRPREREITRHRMYGVQRRVGQILFRTSMALRSVLP
ncbi:hypothetical protein KI387_003690, partial [Taxus chinensis]